MLFDSDIFPFMFLGFMPIIIVIAIIVSIIVFFINHNRNTNNMDSSQMKSKTTAVDFLLNVGAIIALYTVVSSLLGLIFIVVEKAYPKITNGYDYYYSQSISWPISILIVLFPIFITIMWFLEKSYDQNQEKRDLGVHKWLTYITLFVGGAVLIGDLITALYYFIDGQELTTSFLLKVFSVLVITLIVFLYYVADARNTLTSSQKKIWLGISTVVILASIVWGFSVLGSPRTQQLLKYDQQKVSDLQDIKRRVESFYSSKGTLPKNIEEMLGENYYNPQKVDPQNQKPYEYTRTSDTTYDLCAEFNKASDDKSAANSRNYEYLYGTTAWTHPAGQYCFKETINPDIYPKQIPPDIYSKPAPAFPN